MKRTTIWLSLSAAALLAVPAARAVDSLSACGYHSVFLNMEEVPSNFWNYPYNEGAMWGWNQYADIYRVLASNGTWGRNGVNEFGGFPSNTDLNAQWGFNWGTALAMTCYSWPCVCCQISESDVLFNPSQSWTSDLIAAEDNNSLIAYQPVVMHELGHSWGEVTQNESYSYNTTSVMHAYYLGYENRRLEALEAWWPIVNWPEVELRFALTWQPRRGEAHGAAARRRRPETRTEN